jgi:xylulokinase
MKTDELLLGIDLGTSGLKAGVFDPAGRLVARSVVQYDTARPRPGWAEQAPAAWWAACSSALNALLAQLDRSKLRAVCAAGLAPSLTCIDERGLPVGPTPIWSDGRARAEQLELEKRLGRRGFSSLLPRLLWLKRYEPTRYQNTRWALQSYEYLPFKLTGEACAVTNGTSAAAAPSDVAEAVGLDASKFPGRRLRCGEPWGRVCAAAAAETGLPSGLPVVAGTVDAFAAWLGTGTLEPGQLCNTTGTTNTLALVRKEPLEDGEGRFGTVPHPCGDNWMAAGALTSGGQLLDWFRRTFYGNDSGALALLLREAASAPAGAEGLLVLPYLAGERSPVKDPHARAVFFGLSEAHRRAHLARAVVEAAALAVGDLCDVMHQGGGRASEVRLAGPAAQSDLSGQIRADVLGLPVVLPEVADAGALGAAMAAGNGAGLFPSFPQAVRCMARTRAVLKPDPERHALYRRLFALYRDLYCHLREDFARLAGLAVSQRASDVPVSVPAAPTFEPRVSTRSPNGR